MIKSKRINLFTCSKREYIVVSSLLLLSFLLKFFMIIRYLIEVDVNAWGYSEFFINFQNGFVRRGIVGELLFQSYKIHAFPIKTFILTGCIIIFFGLFFFFLRKFKQHNYCWWLLFSPLFLNFPVFIVRKDYLLYFFLIGIIYLLQSAHTSALKKTLAFFLISSGLFIHEAFIFYGGALYIMLMLSTKNNKYLNYIYVCLTIGILALLSIFKGNIDTAHTIIKSWNSILPDQPLIYQYYNSIGAIGWESRDTFLMHLKFNVGEENTGIIIRPIIAVMAYYMFTNFLIVFQESKNGIQEKKNAISLLYSSAIICLIPMLTILSCDTGRVFQYATVTTFSAFIILPNRRIVNMYPTWYKELIFRFNDWLDNFLPPNKGLMIILLLVLAVSDDHFSLYTSFRESVIGSLLNITNL